MGKLKAINFFQTTYIAKTSLLRSIDKIAINSLFSFL